MDFLKRAWAAAKKWWENDKAVILGKVLPAVKAAEPALADFLKSKGMPEAAAKANAAYAISWLIEYIGRQA